LAAGGEVGPSFCKRKRTGASRAGILNECNGLISPVDKILINWDKVLVVTALANFLIAIACGLLWVGFAAPAILRTFGVPVAFGAWRIDRRNQHLKRTQYVWACGVFMWGLGMFVFSTIFRYLDWRLLGDKFSHLSAMRVLEEFLTWLVVGLAFGVFSAPHRKHADSTK
jgi:hypothetical protein